MGKRRMKEPEAAPGSAFAEVIAKGRTMVKGLSSALPADPDARNMILAKIEGMESILVLCQRASAGEPIDAPRLVKIERSVAEGSVEDRLEDLARRVSNLERGLLSTVERPALPVAPARRKLPRLLEVVTTDTGAAKLGKCELALLTVLAQRCDRVTTTAQLSVLSGYSLKSSSFLNALGRLRSLDLAQGGPSDVRATDAGIFRIGTSPPMPTGAALLAYWAGKLGKAEAALLRVLHGDARRNFTAEELSEYSGYSQTSSSFLNAIGKLRGLELATRGWPTTLSPVFSE